MEQQVDFGEIVYSYLENGKPSKSQAKEALNVCESLHTSVFAGDVDHRKEITEKRKIYPNIA